MKPRPIKQHRLVCWHLKYRVPVQAEPIEADERAACQRFRLPWEQWLQAKAQFPQLMANMMAARARRRAFLEEYGRIPDGWTPPDLEVRQSKNYPLYALAFWRRGKPLGGRFGEEMERCAVEGKIEHILFEKLRAHRRAGKKGLPTNFNEYLESIR